MIRVVKLSPRRLIYYAIACWVHIGISNHGLHAGLCLGGSVSGPRVPEIALFRRNVVSLLAQLVATGVILLAQLLAGSDGPRGINLNAFFYSGLFLSRPVHGPARARPAGLFLVRVRSSSCDQCRCKSAKYASAYAP